MQHVDKNPSISHEELSCLIDMFAEEEQLVIFELVVPVGAKVPAPRQHVEMAKLVVSQTSITSTVPTKAAAPLRVNNTAMGAAWCVTATLTAPQSARQR
ncbi:hypothetical protein [Hymenobacter arizonensis]|uniref:Uncharacterized protein n=1 Tax=Hymenobacter arizonensis TaxID=1227077 RepID=A0A1I5UCQ7_HYMAR|nr:hypothetical protein [Hymenobacter arizonensis]SFP93034.1 hypothetical protein SAMN04515668_0865 [Hymenobacter arizonensis]